MQEFKIPRPDLIEKLSDALGDWAQHDPEGESYFVLLFISPYGEGGTMSNLERPKAVELMEEFCEQARARLRGDS
jgi:hypothetical protein